MMTRNLSERLLDVVRTATGRPDLVYTKLPQPLTGGFWAELLQFSVANGPGDWPSDLVIRLMPDESLAARETAVQTAVANAGYPTPTVRVSGDSSGGLGRAFMVMDRASGAALLSGLDGFAALLRVPVLARRIQNVLAHSMADLHAIDPGLVRSQLTGTGLAAMLDALARGAEACDRPDLSVAAARLTSRESSDPDVICHGDLHPLNLLVDEQDAVTVLDWSAATLAPRTYDVGFTSLLLSEPPLALPERLRPLARAIGRRLAARFVHGYEQCAGVRIVPEALAYFQAVVCLRALVEVCEWEAGGVLAQRVGHPWLTNSVSFARRLSAFSGVDVRSR